MQTHMTTQYLHSIIDENEELRVRVSKLEEMQKYMEALLKRCEELEQDKAHLDGKLRNVFEQNGSLQKELKAIHENHRQQIKLVLLQHDSIMRQMQQQLKAIHTDYGRQSILNDELLETKHIKDNQIQSLQEHLKALTRQADHQISQLQSALILNQKQYQLLADQHKVNRSQSLHEKEELTKELYHLKAVVGRQMKRHIDELESENLALTKQAQGLRKYNEEIARNATLREKQLTEEIKNLKHQFQNQQHLLKSQLDHLQNSLTLKTEESSKRLNQSNLLIDQNIRLKRQLQLSLSNQNKFCFMLQESHKQNDDLRTKLIEIDTYIKSETERYKDQFYEQRNHNNELRKVLADKDVLMNQKLREIKDLLNIIDQIQSALKLKDKEIALLKNQSETIEAQVKTHIKNYEQKNLEARTLEQRNRSLKVSIEELQMLNGSLKKQILELQTSNHSLKRQLFNPRTGSKESEQKIQVLVQGFRRDKQLMLSEHQIQKFKMKETHEVEIKQKQLEFLRKVEYFQEELKRLA